MWLQAEINYEVWTPNANIPRKVQWWVQMIKSGDWKVKYPNSPSCSSNHFWTCMDIVPDNNVEHYHLEKSDALQGIQKGQKDQHAHLKFQDNKMWSSHAE